MDKNFDADFYVTCATVIPVLFLALAVQGRAYESVLRAYVRAGEKARRHRPAEQRLMRLRGSWLEGVALMLLVAGAFGELGALLALYRGSERPMQRTVVFILTLILVAAVIAGPWMAYLRSTRAAEGRHDDPPASADAPRSDAE